MVVFPRPSPHVKSHPRPGDLPSLLSGTSREGGSAPTSPQPPQTPVAALGTTQEPVVMPSLHIRDMHIGELGRGRWVNFGPCNKARNSKIVISLLLL